MRDFGNLNAPNTTCTVCGSNNHTSHEHRTLNEAAPELYEACKAALSDFEELVNKSLVPIAKVHPFTRTPEMLRAAIAKAGGNHEKAHGNAVRR